MQIKGEVATKNTMFHLIDIQMLMSNAIQNVTPKNWRRACEHGLRVEENYWKSHNIEEEVVDVLRINFGNREEDDDSEGSESDAMSDVEN